MKHEFDVSTAEGQTRLMRESVGHPTEPLKSKIKSSFKSGQILEFKDINLRHVSNRVWFIRDVKPEYNLPVIEVLHRSGVKGQWLARDFKEV
jgi:hypothetical protein